MVKEMRKWGFNSTMMNVAGLGSIALSIAIWFLRQSDDRANAERFGIFVGLWAPTFFALGNIFQQAEKADEIQEATKNGNAV